MKKLIYFVALILVACATQPDVKPNDVVLATEKETINLPEDQITPCPDLVAPELKAMSQAEVLKFITTIYLPATTCALNHNALIITAKKAFNIKTVPVVPGINDSSTVVKASQ